MSALRVLLSARGIAMVVVLAAIGAALAIGWTAMVAPSYTSTARVYIGVAAPYVGFSAPPGVASFPRERLDVYSTLASSESVLDDAKRIARTDDSTSQLRASLTLSSPAETSLLDITITSSSPGDASRSANGVARALVEAIRGVDAPSPIRGDLVEPAVTPTSRSAPFTRRNLVLGSLLGAALGIIAALRPALRREMADDANEPSQTEGVVRR
ncbi:YveK family protein [Williamsia phyllosphaerae]|uniref:YveK family protein n=1 Tax=Williamsia phyllosphaerae TaxID=885042 RepID=UPI0016660599|nr:hypothetical protein [Williamsia phyllosphaerae]